MNPDESKNYLRTVQLRNCLTPKEQHDILLEIVSGNNFSVFNFLQALKYRFELTPDVVYLAHIRGQEWINACIACQNLATDRVAKLCYMLSEDPTHFYNDCFVGILDKEGTRTEPNFLMAYIIDPTYTLNYMGNLGLWDDILVKILHRAKSLRLWHDYGHLYDYLSCSAPEEWVNAHKHDLL